MNNKGRYQPGVSFKGTEGLKFNPSVPFFAITKGEELFREEAKRLNVDPDLYKSKRVDAPRDAIRKMQKERAIEMCEDNLRVIEAGI